MEKHEEHKRALRGPNQFGAAKQSLRSAVYEDELWQSIPAEISTAALLEALSLNKIEPGAGQVFLDGFKTAFAIMQNKRSATELRNRLGSIATD